MSFNRLDKLIRTLRIHQINKYILPNTVVVDIGCGEDATFLNLISSKIKRGIGIDPKVKKSSTEKIEIRAQKINGELPIDPKTIDIVTLLAVIEHVDDPQQLLNNAYLCLKSEGILLMTTPTPRSRPILEFCALRLKIISQEEILDHKNYYWGYQLYHMLKKAGFKSIEWHEFELGMNTFIKAVK